MSWKDPSDGRNIASKNFGHWDWWLPADFRWKFMELHPFLADSPKYHQIDSSCRSVRNTWNSIGFLQIFQTWQTFAIAAGLMVAMDKLRNSVGLSMAWGETTVRWIWKSGAKSGVNPPISRDTNMSLTVTGTVRETIKCLGTEQSNQFSLPLKCIN